MPSKLRRLIINEGSLVDTPANPLARVMLFKRELPPAEPDKEVSPTAKAPEKSSLMKRLFEGIAKMMKPGAMTMDQMMGMQEKQDELWEKEWQMRDAFDSSVRSIMDDEAMDMDKKKEMLGQTMEQYHSKLTEHMNAMMALMQAAQGNTGVQGGAVSMSKTDPATNDPVKKKEGEDNVTLEEITKALGAMNLSDADRAAMHAAVYKGVQAPIPADITKSMNDLTKRAETAEALAKEANEKLAAEVTKREKAESDLNVHVAKAQDAEFLAKGAKYPHAGTPEQVAAKLRKAHSVSQEFGAEYEADLAKAEEQINKGGLFRELGKSGKAPEGSAEARIEKMAQDRAKADKISFEKAYDLTIQENRDLLKQARAEAEKEGN